MPLYSLYVTETIGLFQHPTFQNDSAASPDQLWVSSPLVCKGHEKKTFSDKPCPDPKKLLQYQIWIQV